MGVGARGTVPEWERYRPPRHGAPSPLDYRAGLRQVLGDSFTHPKS